MSGTIKTTDAAQLTFVDTYQQKALCTLFDIQGQSDSCSVSVLASLSCTKLNPGEEPGLSQGIEGCLEESATFLRLVSVAFCPVTYKGIGKVEKKTNEMCLQAQIPLVHYVPISYGRIENSF